MMQLLALLKAAWALFAARPWIALIAIIAAQVLVIHVRTSERDGLQAWQADVTQATREAADQPTLGANGVARKIRVLGDSLGDVRLAMARVRADALAAKSAREAADEVNRKEFDDALQSELARALRDSDNYARAHGVCSEPTSGTGVDPDLDRGGDLPGAAQATGLIDRSGPGPALVSIPRAALDTCTTLKVRLDNAHAWALEPRP